MLNETQASSLTDRESVETKPSEPAPLNRRKTILLVDDEEGVRDFTVRRLNVLGYDTITAADGEQGVRIFRERLNEIDLVILDFAMPRMNGVEAFEELIRIKPDVKVILCSGYTEEAVMKSFHGSTCRCGLAQALHNRRLEGRIGEIARGHGLRCFHGCKLMTDKMNLDETRSSASILRHRAEGKISRSPDTTQNLKGKTRAEIIHELQVHQIELEMQNEELKRVQFELEKSRDDYQDNDHNLYDFAPVGYFTLTRKGLIKDVNLSGAALLGIPRQELIGRGFGYFVAPESLHLWDKLIVAALGHEEKQSCDLTLKQEDESSFSAHLDTKRIVMPVEPQEKTGDTLSISMVVSDISERIWMENELRSGKEEWERTFNAVPDLIAILNNGYKIIRVNRAMAQQLGLEAEDCIGMHCYKAVHGTDAPPTYCPHSHLLRDGKEHSVEVHEDYLGGDYLVTASPLRDADSRVVGSVLVARDISERKLAEAEIKGLTEDLENRVSERTAELVLTNQETDRGTRKFEAHSSCPQGHQSMQQGDVTSRGRSSALSQDMPAPGRSRRIPDGLGRLRS